ncbi:putative GTPase activating protein for Arf domain containing protein [Amanita muscaria]
MSRQDKAVSERHARSLRELVKRPENKVCADCKRNGALLGFDSSSLRAKFNQTLDGLLGICPSSCSYSHSSTLNVSISGVFLCIRCSGIHRGMGTHISKIKSVDLDIWTPEQMESIQKWGNRRANLYWEAHLKLGHVPPEHKMESFIRSKYESRRWAMEGPLPQDPSVLEQTGQDAQQTPPPSGPSHVKTNSTTVVSQSALQTAAAAVRQPQTHQLLSANFSTAGPTTSSTSLAPLKNAAAEPQVSAPNNDLFSLDFHAPARETASATFEQPKKDVKQDILSLYSTTTKPQTSTAVPQASASPWAAGVADSHKAPTSMIGTNGVGAWGASSGWTAAAPAQPNLWGDSGTVPVLPSQSSLLNTSDIWSTSSSSQNQPSHDLFNTTTQNVAKKDDVFGDLWGGYR